MKPFFYFSFLFFSFHSFANFTAEFGAYSDFIWRGTTFTENQPALQANLDFEEAHGLFFGAFASNAKFSDEALSENSAVTQETDLMLGKRWSGNHWDLQLMYGQFLFPNAEVFNTDEFNLTGTYKNLFFELSYMDDYFGYQSIYKYLRLGYKFDYNESLSSSLSIGYNAFSRPKGKLKSRCLDSQCTEKAYTTTGAGNPDYIDIYFVNQKTFENQMTTELSINWTNRDEFEADASGITKSKARDFAVVVGLIIPFNII